MSNFKDLLNTGGKKPQGRSVDIWVDCQDCDEETNNVEYFPNEKTIIFTCPAGHRNFIENFQVQL